jgi:thiol-disulfide isomerase/thioredoxin
MKRAQEILSGINPYTTLIRIDVEPIATGTPLPTCFGLRSALTGESVAVECKPNQILLINFWASWCEGSIAYANFLNEEFKEVIDKVRVVNLNLDKSVAAGSKKIKEAGWTNLEQIHIGDSNADLVLGASSIPRIILTDLDGKIAYIGLPKKINLRECLAQLLKGETLALEPEILNQDDFSKEVT